MKFPLTGVVFSGQNGWGRMRNMSAPDWADIPSSCTALIVGSNPVPFSSSSDSAMGNRNMKIDYR